MDMSDVTKQASAEACLPREAPDRSSRNLRTYLEFQWRSVISLKV